MSLLGLRFNGSNDSVQGLVFPGLNVTLAVTDAPAPTNVLGTQVVLICATAFIHLEINATATSDSIIIPPGQTFWGLEKSDFLSFLSLAGSPNSQVSVVIPKQ